MKTLTYRGSFVKNDGYGRISTDLVLAFWKRGWDIYLSDINQAKYTKSRAHNLIAENYDKLFVHRNTQYQITHAPPTSLPPRVSVLTKHVVFTTFETNKPPSNWKRRIEQTAQALIVTSHWVKEVFQRALDIQVPIHVVHHGFNLPPIDVEEKWMSPTPFRFLMVAAAPFDARKNGWMGLNAFRYAFPKADEENVEFWVMGHSMPNIELDDYRIKTFTGDMNDAALHEIYKMCHVLVSPARGEGFGLPIFEGMHFGLIPIVTDWSTPGYLIPESIAYKVPVKKMLPVVKGGDNPYWDVFFQEDQEDLGEWAEPSFHKIVEYMRQAYENRNQLMPKAMGAAGFVSTFTTSKMADEVEEVLVNL